ncbi:MAG: RHS repeat-associated core domain-containing protein, partial [Pyrinomonadaceae bacterium]
KKISNTETTIFVYNASGQLVAEYSTALAQTQQVSYLTNDHLGSPRVTTNEDGVVTGRKDYSAFGEESFTAQRTSSLGYTGGGELRKGYTGYEKDEESGLDFAQARYYSSTHGRYTSVDPLTASASIRNPQTFNRYSYVLNSPYKFTDPLGLIPVTTGACGGSCPNSGPTVDGSSIRGRDATWDWAKQFASPPALAGRGVNDIFTAILFFDQITESRAYQQGTVEAAIYDSGNGNYIETPAGRERLKPFIQRLITVECGTAFKAAGLDTPNNVLRNGDVVFAARELLESSDNNVALGISEEARVVKDRSAAPASTLLPSESTSGTRGVIFVRRDAFTSISNMIFTDFAAHEFIHGQGVRREMYRSQITTPFGLLYGHDLSAFSGYDRIVQACGLRQR